MKKSRIAFVSLFVLMGLVALTAYKSEPNNFVNDTPSEGYAILRTTEIYGMKPSSMVTIYEDGTVETVKLNKLNASKMEENLLVVHSKVAEIAGKGYTLVSTTGGNSDNVICTTYIFKKN